MPIKKRTANAPTESTPTVIGKSTYPHVPDSLAPYCVEIGTIQLDPKNPRKNDAAAKKLAELIRINGFRKPIVVDQNGIIRAGNTAYKASQILGLTHIPVAQSNFASEAAAVAYSISDNKASEYSEWDDDVLMDLMQAEELTQAGTGFSDKEWKGLQLSDEAPQSLQPVDIKGASREQGEFIIVRFESPEEMESFKERLGMGKFERATTYEQLRKSFDF